MSTVNQEPSQSYRKGRSKLIAILGQNLARGHAQRIKELENRRLRQDIQMKYLNDYLALSTPLQRIESMNQFKESGLHLRAIEECSSIHLSYITLINGRKMSEEEKVMKRIYCFQYHLSRLPEGSEASLINSMKILQFLHIKRQEKLQTDMFLIRAYNILQLMKENEPSEIFISYDRFSYNHSLKHRIWNNEQSQIDDIKKWVLQLAGAVEKLNLLGIANRFLRPETILLTKNDEIKIINFDMAINFTNHNRIIQSDRFNQIMSMISRSMLDHLPPEYFDNEYDCSNIDIWSIATILVSFITGGTPFNLDSNINLIEQWKRSYQRKTLSDEVRTLLDDIFQSPDQRMITFDLINDCRLIKPASFFTRVKMLPYYRIDIDKKLNLDEEGIKDRYGSQAWQPVSISTNFSIESIRLFNYKSYHSFKSEVDLNSLGYYVIRNQSFGKEFDIFHNDDFMKATIVRKANTNSHSKLSVLQSVSQKSINTVKAGGYLVKIILLTRIPYRHRNMLLNESSRIMRFFSSEKNSWQFLHKTIEIFVVNKAKMYIFYEDLLSFRSIYDIVIKGPVIPASSINKWFIELSQTIDYLTYFGVSHRYIRPEYIFITLENQIKLTHLDLACFIWNPNKSLQVPRHKGVQDEQIFLWNHLPPEVWNEKYDSLRVDIWSFGVCLTFALTKKFPFNIPALLGDWKLFKNRFTTSLELYSNILDKIFKPIDSRISIQALVEEFKGLANYLETNKNPLNR